MPELKLYVSTFCPFCRKVEIYLEDNNIDDVTIINIDDNLEERNFLVEVGGKKQVPCLFVDGEPMYESNDILDFFKNRE